MRGIPRIKNVMTAFPYHVESDASLDDAVRLMAEHDIRHLPVMEHSKLVGVVSDRDIHALVENLTIGQEAQDLKVSDASIDEPYVVDLNERLDSVLMHMADKHIGSVLVTRQERLAGLFTVTDACRCYAEFLRRQYGPGNDDPEVA